MDKGDLDRTVEAKNGDEFIFAEPDAELLFACCDCGLVHEIRTRITDEGLVAMRVITHPELTQQIREEAGHLSATYGEWTTNPPKIEGWWWARVSSGDLEGLECVYVYKEGGNYMASNIGRVDRLPAKWCPAVQPPEGIDV